MRHADELRHVRMLDPAEAALRKHLDIRSNASRRIEAAERHEHQAGEGFEIAAKEPHAAIGAEIPVESLSRFGNVVERFRLSADEREVVFRASLSKARRSASACQLRPDITPPSTSQIAPVTQPALSDSRNATTSATSCGVPIRPSGWKLLKPCSAPCTSAFGIKPS